MAVVHDQQRIAAVAAKTCREIDAYLARFPKGAALDSEWLERTAARLGLGRSPRRARVTSALADRVGAERVVRPRIVQRVEEQRAPAAGFQPGLVLDS